MCSSVYCIVCAKIYASFPTCQQHRDNKVLLLVPSTLNTLLTMVQLKPDIYTMIVESMLAARCSLANVSRHQVGPTTMSGKDDASFEGKTRFSGHHTQTLAGWIGDNVAQLYIESGRKLRLVLRSGLLGSGSVV